MRNNFVFPATFYLQLAVLAVVFILQANCQVPSRCGINLPYAILQEHNSLVDSTSKRTSRGVILFLNTKLMIKNIKSIYNYGFISFKRNRNLLYQVKQNGYHLLIYRHGNVGTHTHVILFNLKKLCFKGYDFNGDDSSYNSIINTINTDNKEHADIPALSNAEEL